MEYFTWINKVFLCRESKNVGGAKKLKKNKSLNFLVNIKYCKKYSCKYSHKLSVGRKVHSARCSLMRSKAGVVAVAARPLSITAKQEK